MKLEYKYIRTDETEAAARWGGGVKKTLVFEVCGLSEPIELRLSEPKYLPGDVQTQRSIADVIVILEDYVADLRCSPDAFFPGVMNAKMGYILPPEIRTMNRGGKTAVRFVVAGGSL